MMSTPTGILWTPASLSSEAISLACRSISPNAGLTVPRRPMRPALQSSGLSQGVQPAVIDPFLEVDPHGAERRQRAGPVVTRVDIVGADLADRLVHGSLSCAFLCLRWRQAGAQVRDYTKLFIAAVMGGLHNSWPRRAPQFMAEKSPSAADDESRGSAPWLIPPRSSRRRSMRAPPSTRSRA